MESMDRTGFRMWFEDCLRSLRGRKVEWPQLLRHILCEEVQEVHSSGVYYAGEVFIDRGGLTGRFRNVTSVFLARTREIIWSS